jgi:Dyp-type peroxidase family
MDNLNLQDIQGLIKRGYNELPFSNILLLRVEDALKVKQWLARLLPDISRGDLKNPSLEINIAFTYAGLAALGLPRLLQKRFSLEFEEGMSEDSRSRLLGDYDPKTKRSTVADWDWRDGEGDSTVHLLLVIYGPEEHLVEKYCDELQLGYPDSGLRQIRKLVTIKREENREHFGFQDGISQPNIEAFGHRTDALNNTVALGEFLLGYPNQYGKIPAGPTVTDPNSGQEWDFGRNGTYLVMRQLEQDVKGFWQYMADHSKNPDGTLNVVAAIALAAKLVGRWPSGVPLTISPDQDAPLLQDKNNFLFGFQQEENYGKCPVGAHIARVNPRDALAKDPKQSLKIASHHRILRRGRPYGRPFITSMEPEELFSKAYATAEERGLHFICLNANISQQFEFIQSSWINNKKFNGLYNDADQVAGSQESDFTIQQRPVCRHLPAIPAFVKVKGGGYFFMPSHAALKFLTEN